MISHFNMPTLIDATARKYFISNAYSLVKATKGKNIIISSGARNLLELRGVFDIINMSSLFNLARDSMTKECHNAVMHGGKAELFISFILTRLLSLPLPLSAIRAETLRGVVSVERTPPDLAERSDKWKVRRIE